ncbi:MAG: hypothetical protein A2Z34_08120 [Planctomycetes bacterium RBG_16_59_8]|nr:MAG: hypothetical protein A2Z34_08120 [Planctomycetes bacterium RBG_16_59_8]
MMKPIFDAWKGKPLQEVMMICRDLVEDQDFPTVKKWRETAPSPDGKSVGGKVIGHFQVYFPEEIAHAGGFLPLKIRGAQVETRKGESHFGSYLCSILKTSLELVLSKRIELDMFVTHPICDAARNLAAVWGRNFSYPCQILYLPQNANSGYAGQYLRDEYDRLRKELEAIAGRPIADDDLRKSIALFNENRRLLHRIYDIKREQPWLLAVDEAFILTAVGGLIPREEHNDLLRYILPLIEARQAKKQDKIRLVFAGGFCELPPLDLMRVIAQSCYVVDDDLLVGLRWILEDVPAAGDPLLNLAKAYLDKSAYSPVQHDDRKPKEKMLLDQIHRSKATAAVITAAKMCEPGLEEQVAYSKSLDEHKVPYFISEFEEKMTSYEHLGIQLETFAENIIFD